MSERSGVHRLLHDAPAAARAASLRYVSPDEPGFFRRGSGKSFFYVDANGKRVKDQDTLARIAKLGIPPAWDKVWICASEDG
ncbi:MAG: DNA topoisomerase IB, partial [Polyangiaceae bacterium]